MGSLTLNKLLQHKLTQRKFWDARAVSSVASVGAGESGRDPLWDNQPSFTRQT